LAASLGRPVLSAVVVASLAVAGAMTIAAGDSPAGVDTTDDTADDAPSDTGEIAGSAAGALLADRATGFGVSRGSARPQLRDDAAVPPDRSGAEAGVSGAARVDAPSDPREIAKAMLARHGWSSSEFSCLDELWIGESNWDPSAENPTSGAYGIPQALPGDKMATAGSDWQTNPATQIEWGLGYIAARYGSPCAANSFKLSNGWY
jgi:hypothetical protein